MSDIQPVGEGPVTLTHLHVTLNGEPVVFHPHYLSTPCLHALHDQCKGKCKFCEERCRCDCHKEPAEVDPGRIEVS